MMRSKYVIVAISLVALLGLAGCATSEEIEALRAETAAAQATADQALERANAAYDLASEANAKADAAAAAAAAADAKAESVYSEFLRK